jgi:hypothetical protein
VHRIWHAHGLVLAGGGEQVARRTRRAQPSRLLHALSVISSWRYSVNPRHQLVSPSVATRDTRTPISSHVGAHPRSCGTRCCPRTPWMCFGQCWTTSGGERNVMCERNAIREELYIIHTRGSILRNKRKPKSHMIIDLARERNHKVDIVGRYLFLGKFW